MVLSLEKYDALVQQIYDAALAPAQWPKVVSEIAVAVGGSHSQLLTLLHGPSDGGFVFTENIPQSMIERWGNTVVGHDPVTQAVIDQGLFVQGVAVNGRELISDRELKRSALYEQLWEPMGIEDVCAGFVFDGTDSRILPTAMTVYRNAQDAPFGEEQKKLMRMLTMHLSRSLGVMFHLRDRELRVASTLAALNRLPAAVILLNAKGQVEFINQAAEAVLRSGDPITSAKRGDGRELRLHLRLNRLQVRFRELLNSAVPARKLALDHGDHFCNALVLPDLDGKPSHVVHSSPLGQCERLGLGCTGILIIYDLTAASRVSAATLSKLFGLTPAEARVALELLRGGTAVEIAARLNVSEHTVRTQTTAVYAKTGTRRHTELLKLLLALASEIA